MLRRMPPLRRTTPRAPANGQLPEYICAAESEML